MKRFRYLQDPLFLVCCSLYVLNRALVKPLLPFPFLHNWFNDLLLIPCALPPLLFLHRRLGWREHDGIPSAGEIFAHLAGWAVLFEVFGPHFTPHSVGDPWDIVAYVVGALFSCLWWRREARTLRPIAQP